MSVALERKLMPCGAEPSGTFGPKLRALCGLVNDAKFDANPGLDDDDVADGGPLPLDAGGVDERKQVRARALWHMKSRIVSAIIRGNKPILDRYMGLYRSAVRVSAQAATVSPAPTEDQVEEVEMDEEAG